MIVLFGLLFSATIIFILYFLAILPGDLKKLSLRPLFVMLFIIAFWIATLPAFLVPESTVTTTFPTTNVIANQIGTSTANILYTYPLYTTSSVATISVRAYNSFFLVWLPLLGFYFFLLLLWFLLLLKARAAMLLKAGKDSMEEFDLFWRGKK